MRDAQLVGDALAGALQPEVGEVLRERLGDRDRQDQRADAASRRSRRGQLERRVRVASRWSTTSASGHGLASSASASTTRRRGGAGQRAPAGAGCTGAACAVSCRPPEQLRRSVVRCAPSRSSCGAAGRERSSPRRLGQSIVRRCTRSDAEPLEPPRAARLLVLLGRGVRDDERRHARADDVERGVVAALADRGARALAQLGGEVGDGAHELDAVWAAAAAGAPNVASGISGPAMSAHRHAGRRRRGSIAARSSGSPTRPPPAETTTTLVAPEPAPASGRGRRSPCSGRGRASGGSARTSPRGGRSAGRSARAPRRGARRRARGRGRRGALVRARLTRMSRRLHAVNAPSARAASSSGTSSRANFARPNGNSSTSTTAGAAPRAASRGCARVRTAQARSVLKRGSRAAEAPFGADAERRQRARARRRAAARCRRGSSPPHSSTTRKRSVSARAQRVRAHQVAEADASAGSRRAARASCAQRLAASSVAGEQLRAARARSERPGARG